MSSLPIRGSISPREAFAVSSSVNFERTDFEVGTSFIFSSALSASLSSGKPFSVTAFNMSSFSTPCFLKRYAEYDSFSSNIEAKISPRSISFFCEDIT